MVDDDFDPVIARLQCGELLFDLRENYAKVKFADAAKVIGTYAGKLSKIENGDVAPGVDDVEKLISLYGLPGDRADELRELSALARRRSPSTKVGGSSRKYVSLERRATEIRMAYNEIPGLLQDEEFAEVALSRSLTVPAANVPALAKERAERGRHILREGGAEVSIVLGEDALRREFGGRATLRRQLVYLRNRIFTLSNVKFRVCTFDVGGVPALSCPFTLLYLGQGKSYAYVASLTRTDYIKETGPYLATFRQAWELARSEAESLAILDDRITDLTDE